jgi:alcohol dehydrogenase
MKAATQEKAASDSALGHALSHDEEWVASVKEDTSFGHGLNYHHPSAGDLGYQFYMPPVSFMGVGALQRCGRELKTNKGLTKALVVTDQVLHKIGATAPVEQMLKDAGIDYVFYDKVAPNPTIEQVEEGVKVYKDAGADGIISFGGGSPHDAAKGIGIVVSNGGHIQDYEGVDKMKQDMPMMVAINTTAGTASELTRFTIISDHVRLTKMAIVDWRCTPSIAVNDPNLMVGMPKGLTAATGMDALTHAIEAYVSNSSFPITDASALHAMRLIPTYLPTAVRDPTNIKARDMMSYAEYLAGMAFNSAGLGYVHAMSHQLGGFYDLPHGVCNAVLLPAVQEHNAKHVPELFIDIAGAMGITGVAEDSDQAISKVLDRIRSLSKEVGIPPNLKVLGAKPEDFPTLATNAMKDACALSNPVEISHEDIMALFQQAYDQE